MKYWSQKIIHWCFLLNMYVVCFNNMSVNDGCDEVLDKIKYSKLDVQMS